MSQSSITESEKELRVVILPTPPPSTARGVINVTESSKSRYLTVVRSACLMAEAKYSVAPVSRNAGAIKEFVEGYAATVFLLPNSLNGLQVVPSLPPGVRICIIELPELRRGRIKYPTRAEVFSLDRENLEAVLASWLVGVGS